MLSPKLSKSSGEGIMSDNSAPTHRAYVVSQPREKGGKNFWHEVGVVWPHKSGTGVDVVVRRHRHL
jgi:hypothetical protein